MKLKVYFFEVQILQLSHLQQSIYNVVSIRPTTTLLSIKWTSRYDMNSSVTIVKYQL